MIPGAKSQEAQGWLLLPPEDLTITNEAAKRNYTGRMAEDVAARVFNCELLKIDGRSRICPDARLGEKEFMEIKASGKCRGALVYQWRIEKEKEFLRSEECERFYYTIVKHNVRNEDFSTENELRDRAVETGVTVHFLSLSKFCHVLACCGEPRRFKHIKEGPPLTKDGRPHGSFRGDYLKGGWCVPTAILKNSTPHEFKKGTVDYYGRELPVTLMTGEEIPARYLKL